MKINIKEIEAPTFSSYSLGGNLDKEALQKNKVVTIEASLDTKTQVYTSLQVGMYRVGVNWAIEGFKFAQRSKNNFLDFERVDVSYFKKLKSQGVDEYMEYIKKVVEIFMERAGVEIEDVTILFINKAFK